MNRKKEGILFIALLLTIFITVTVRAGVGICDEGDEDTICNITTPHTFSTNQEFNFTEVYLRAGGSIELSSGGNLTLNASVVIIEDTANLTAQIINITAENLTIDTGGIITAEGKGYTGGGAGNGTGPGQGGYDQYNAWGGGAGHAGIGGMGNPWNMLTTGGTYYGSITEPTDLGSGGGGGGASYPGGAGGGWILINITDTLNITGSVTSNAKNATSGGGGGGGSGGSIWIQTTTLEGTGSISSNGGDAAGSNGGAGAAGRIAIYYTTDNFAGTITAYGGSTGTEKAAAGTIYKRQTSTNGNLVIDNSNNIGTETPLTETSYAFNDFTTNNSANVTLTNNIILDTNTLNTQSSYLKLGSNNTFNVGEMTLHDGTQIYTSSTDTTINGTSLYVSFGTATLDIPLSTTIEPTFANITIYSGATLTHSASSANNYSIILNSTANITVEGNINVTGKGYAGGAAGNGSGPGGGGYEIPNAWGAGAGHGSNGGDTYDWFGSHGLGGSAYDSLTEPTDLGSGGGGGGASYPGGRGGGAVKLTTSDTLTVTGSIVARGNDGTSGAHSGGGAGGSIWIQTTTLEGTGSITADGGNSGATNGGGGSGGRVAIYYTNFTYTGTQSANGGTGYQVGGNGTILQCGTIENMTCSGYEGGNLTIKSDNVELRTEYTVTQNVSINKTVNTEWTQYLLRWNETSTDITTTATYNITGLNASTLYTVYGNNLYVTSLETDENGDLPLFSIVLSQDIEVRVTNSTTPTINLELPDNDTTNLTTNLIDFTYNVTDDGDLSNCSLIINDEINVTDTTMLKDTASQNFTVYLPNAEYNWSINCTDSTNDAGYSEIRNISINYNTIPNFEPIYDFSKDEDFTQFTINLQDNISDSQDADNLLTYNWTVNDTNILTLNIVNTTGIATFTSVANASGNALVAISVVDTGGLSNSTTFIITVNAVNDAPWLELNSPDDNTTNTTTNVIDFTYIPHDVENSISNCSLIVNDEINATDSNVTLDATNNLTTNLPNGEYNWSVNCTDNSNNIGASETRNLSINYVTTSTTPTTPTTGGGSSGASYSGSPGPRTTTISISKEDLKTGTNVIIRRETEYDLNIRGLETKIDIKNIDGKSVTLWIYSDDPENPEFKEITLNIGGRERVDLDRDGYGDLWVELRDIQQSVISGVTNYEANLYLKEMNPPTKGTEKELAAKTTPQNITQPKVTPEEETPQPTTKKTIIQWTYTNLKESWLPYLLIFIISTILYIIRSYHRKKVKITATKKR